MPKSIKNIAQGLRIWPNIREREWKLLYLIISRSWSELDGAVVKVVKLFCLLSHTHK
jgi:hypothetical protein